jgi:hypothetical protein
MLFVHYRLFVTLGVSVRWPEAVCAGAGLVVAVLAHDRTILRSILGSLVVGVWEINIPIYNVFKLYWATRLVWQGMVLR